MNGFGFAPAISFRLSTWFVLAAIVFCGCGRFDFWSDANRVVERNLSLAKKRYEQRDYSGAISAYEDILKIQPGFARAHLRIGLIYDHNLNDYLSAAYHYQRFLQLAEPDSAEADLAKSSLENARLQFAATVPNSAGQGSPELVKLRSENSALHRQVDDLKREIVRLRGKPEAPSQKAEKTETPKPPVPSLPSQAKASPPAKPAIKPPPVLKTYTVKKGDGFQSIAEKVYGDRSRWRDIMAANPKIKNPNRLTPGEVLVLPQQN